MHDDDAETRAVQQHEGRGKALADGLQSREECAGEGTQPHTNGHVTQAFREDGDEIGVVVEEPREILGEGEAENSHHETHDELPDEAHLQRAHEALVQRRAAAVGDQRHHSVGYGVHGNEHEELHTNERARSGDGGGGLGGIDSVRGKMKNVLVTGDGEDAVGEANDHSGKTHVHHVADQLPIGDEIGTSDRDSGTLGDEVPETERDSTSVGNESGVRSATYANVEYC